MTSVLCAMAACAAVALELPNGRIVRTVETNGVTAVYFELTPEPTSFIRGVVALPPIEKWNGRLKGLGGGGPANYLNDKGPVNAAMQGWAAVYSDLGSSRGVSTPAQIRDYGHRATHLACTTAKALVQEKYGKPAHHAYFVGGSTGGGQGFHEMLRYPDDYDGVISMVPANTRLPLHVYFAWNLRLMTDAAGKSIFSDAELAAVEEAAIDVFRDKDEPWARGRFLTDSRYDPETEKAIVARAIARAPSLNRPDLLDRLHKLFTGPVLDGKRIHAGVPFSGSFRKAAGNQWMLQWYLPKGRPLHSVTDAELIDWLKTWGPDCNACDPDVSAFAARGGKLLVWAGLEDSICPYPALMDWHDAAERKVGRETLDACCRMYLLPGLAHGRGRGLGGVDDAERIIIDWVERGIRPEVVQGSLRDGTKIDLKPYPACFEKPARERVKVLFDTDMKTDYDDIGALAMLHALADAGECELLSVVQSSRGNAGLAVVEIVNKYYGRADILVGAMHEGGVVHPGDAHAFGLLEKYAGDYRYRDSAKAPAAVDVMRQTLAAQPDGSVVVCAVGFMTNLRDLLLSKGDRYSPLDGKALVAQKVKKAVIMACSYPNGSEHNSKGDWEASKVTFEEWPTPIVFTDYQYGRHIYAGRVVSELPDTRNPVRDAFRFKLPSRDKVNDKTYDRLAGHPSWDETAVLAAVRPLGMYFNVERGTYQMVGTKGDNVWIADPKSANCRLVDKATKEEVGRAMDELMCRPPRR